jgi:hypothetical protein
MCHRKSLQSSKLLRLAVTTLVSFAVLEFESGEVAGSAAVTATGPAFDGASFPAPFRPDLPYDVDTAALRRLSTTPDKTAPPYDIAAGNLPAAQRLFDIFAWQSFLALNWPATSDGQPDTGKTLADATATRVWEFFVDAGLVFQQDGAAPATWSQSVKATQSQRVLWMVGMSLGTPAAQAGKKGGFRHPTLLSESLQAFTGPMVDQAGHWVRYQVALNNTEFDYLVSHQLYNLEGEAKFTAANQVEFPANVGTERRGAMEIKMSWKQLTDRDDASRYFVRRAKALRLDGSTYDADFGLVGMHIAARTESSPTWVWATFEHIDNTGVNDLERDRLGRPLRPSFFNPDSPAKPVNVLAAKNSAKVQQFDPATGKDSGPGVSTSWDETKTTDPTQTLMVLPISKSTAALNAEVQSLLAQTGSVFRYYQLIGTQWPAEPRFPAFPNGVSVQSDGRLLPASLESIVFKVPGKVVPVFLVNTTMETFFQVGNQTAGPVAADDRLPPGNVADPAKIFSTESCTGCHFSAGACIGFKRDSNGRYLVEDRNGKLYRIPIFGVNAVRGLTGNADYSWLLQLRAQSAPYEGRDTAPVTEVLLPGSK